MNRLGNAVVKAITSFMEASHVPVPDHIVRKFRVAWAKMLLKAEPARKFLIDDEEEK